jgi:hypothetical protein
LVPSPVHLILTSQSNVPDVAIVALATMRSARASAAARTQKLKRNAAALIAHLIVASFC